VLRPGTITETLTPRWAMSLSARRSARSGRKYGVLMRTWRSAPSINS
jgi:hypothetical protein